MPITSDGPVAPKTRVEPENTDWIERGVSPCCNAKIDESRVIQFGKYKNHGPRFCSMCLRWLYTV